MSFSIELDGIGKSFGEKRILDGLSLRVEPGTILGYLGANGAGKTTTVHILTGLISDFEGEARVAGHDVRTDWSAARAQFGLVPENAVVYEGLSAHEFLYVIGQLRQLDEGLVEARSRDLLEMFEVADRMHDRLGNFSKGMRQKVMIAAALLHDPAVIFLDEPLSGLDVDSTARVKDLLRALADCGKTVFYCSHVMDVVERVCDRIVILDQGTLGAEGTFEELAAREGDRSLEDLFRRLTRSESSTQQVQEVVERLISGAKE